MSARIGAGHKNVEHWERAVSVDLVPQSRTNCIFWKQHGLRLRAYSLSFSNPKPSTLSRKQPSASLVCSCAQSDVRGLLDIVIVSCLTRPQQEVCNCLGGAPPQEY